ncbi:hypothetical protein AOY38_00780 [Synechocystis sp. PCC 6803]|jgi:hypothetical protein|nr:hypothetical protein AOY38_00780 [Synechocystis sp. PCC 6803]AVP88352.1 hypothetical protein C7I86_00795 [Synechocystis sp. IPPAS B-1465]BAM50435.1 Uncharacterized NAD(FAD)-dependentdehydrogenases [Synechocystis sp. PCC 6803] [Bacillus subtilis BEST7613]
MQWATGMAEGKIPSQKRGTKPFKPNPSKKNLVRGQDGATKKGIFHSLASMGSADINPSHRALSID